MAPDVKTPFVKPIKKFMKSVNKKQGIGWIVCKMKGDMEKDVWAGI